MAEFGIEHTLVRFALEAMRHDPASSSSTALSTEGRSAKNESSADRTVRLELSTEQLATSSDRPAADRGGFSSADTCPGSKR